MSSLTQDDFVERIRSVLGRKKGAPVPSAPKLPEGLLRLQPETDNLAAVFSQQATACGMEVVECVPSKLTEVIVGLCEGIHGNVQLSVGDHALRGALATSLGTAKVTSGVELAAPFDQIYDCAISCTEVVAAVAETGSLAVQSDGDTSRGAFLVAPFHIAIVREHQLVPDLMDLWAQLPVDPCCPAAVVLITGPSKTADIEGILVTGVHGPQRVVVVLVRDR